MVDSSSAGRGLFSFQNEKEDRSEQPRTASISDVLEVRHFVCVCTHVRHYLTGDQLQNSSTHTVVASYSELYEEGEVEHIKCILQTNSCTHLVCACLVVLYIPVLLIGTVTTKWTPPKPNLSEKYGPSGTNMG